MFKIEKIKLDDENENEKSHFHENIIYNDYTNRYPHNIINASFRKCKIKLGKYLLTQQTKNYQSKDKTKL